MSAGCWCSLQGDCIIPVRFRQSQPAVAFTIREAGLNVPILIFGCQEEEVLNADSPYDLKAIGRYLRCASGHRSAGY